MSGADFVGQGWSWPAGVGHRGGIALVSGDTELGQAIRLILGTALGERPMRPEFGCRIHDFAFAPADATTASDIGFEVQKALGRWEPRINVEDVVVSFDGQDAGLLYIDIRYSIRRSNDKRNLVFPFYVIPGEGEE